jgi:hypothetical protein
MEIRDVLPRDAIPSVDAPSFGTAYFGESDDEVLVVDGSPPRAYPIRILSAHEIVNDVIDGRPLAVTWCPICWSGAVYDRTVDERVLTFGVSGKLADDALVVYDRETGSEWRQTTGECIAGDLAGTDLEVLPTTTTTWAAFREAHPDGRVLQPPRGGGPSQPSPADAYDMTRYRAYVDREGFGLHAMRGEGEPRTWGREGIDAKTVVLGVERDGEAVGYPLPRVRAAGGVVRDTVGGQDVLVAAVDGHLSAFESPGLDLHVADGGLDGDGTTWNPVTGESADGRALRRLPARTLFAFAWQDAHGPDAFYESEPRD